MSQEQAGVVKTAGFLMLTIVISRILGYARDVVIYYFNGQNSATDAYNAAFFIPDFLYMLLVGGALSSALIPVFSSYLANDQDEEAWRTASIITNLVLVLLLAGIAIGLLYTPSLVYLLVPRLPADAVGLTIKLTRIMFAQTFFMALNGISMGILHSHKHFIAPAVGSILYNLMIIVVGWWLHAAYNLGVMGFSIGVVVGAAANLLVCIPSLIKVGLRYRLLFNLRHPGVKRVLSLTAPVLIGLSVTQFNLFVTQNLASGLPEGMISALRTAQRLMQVPVGVFAIAVAIAVFPTLTQQSARGETAEFKRTLSLGIRTVIFITLPSAVGLIALRTPIVQLLFEQGAFDANDTLATSQALLFYSLGLIGYSAQQVLNRAFYAIQDTWTPVLAGIATIFLNIGLSYWLVKPMGHQGLALAYSIAGLFNMAVLLSLLRPRLGRIGGRQLLASFTLTLCTSLLMGAAVALAAGWLAGAVHLHPKINQLITVLAGVGVGALVFAGASLLLKQEEAEMVKGLLLSRFRRA